MIVWLALALALLANLLLAGFALGVWLGLRKAAPYLQMFSALGQTRKPPAP